MTHVVFGTGPVGLALVEHLDRQGEKIRAVNRSGHAVMPMDIELLKGDASDAEFAAEAIRGASVVYQCLNPPYSKWPEQFPPLQKALIEGASATGAKLVSFENLYLYGPTGGNPLTEDSPAAATGPKGTVRGQMARDLIDAHNAGKVRIAIGRASDYFGPRGRVTSMGERVFYPVLAGRNAQVLGDPSHPHTYSYIPDIAAGLAALGIKNDGDGRAWHLPNPQTLPTEAFIHKIYTAAGTNGKVSAMPKPLLSLVSLFNADVRELKEVRYQVEAPFVVDSTAFETTFQQSATPLGSAIESTLEWYRANPR